MGGDPPVLAKPASPVTAVASYEEVLQPTAGTESFPAPLAAADAGVDAPADTELGRRLIRAGGTYSPVLFFCTL